MSPDEAETIAGIVETMRSITAKTLEDSGHVNRSVHAKAHALLEGEMIVRDGLPEAFAQGVFATPKTYLRGYQHLAKSRRHSRRQDLGAPRSRAQDHRRRGGRLAGSEDMTTQGS